METLVKSKMLIVEDDILQIYIAKKILDERFDIETAINGYAALDLIEKQEFDIVLMDINLGDASMDGIRVMRTMRQDRRFRHTKIVALTAHSHLRDWYISEGFNELIIKPILGETIFDILESIPHTKNVYDCVY